jgi:flagellar hook-length control protein FliK
MAVTITTERAETQDLMRRHIDMLAQEMRELGYKNVGFSFEGRGGGDHESQTTPGQIIEQEMHHADAPSAVTAAQSGLDLRL